MSAHSYVICLRLRSNRFIFPAVLANIAQSTETHLKVLLTAGTPNCCLATPEATLDRGVNANALADWQASANRANFFIAIILRSVYKLLTIVSRYDAPDRQCFHFCSESPSIIRTDRPTYVDVSCRRRMRVRLSKLLKPTSTPVSNSHPRHEGGTVLSYDSEPFLLDCEWGRQAPGDGPKKVRVGASKLKSTIAGSAAGRPAGQGNEIISKIDPRQEAQAIMMRQTMMRQRRTY